MTVVYHCGYGHTAKQARAVARGVDSVDGVERLLISVDEIDMQWDNLERSDGIIVGARTYMGSASAQFKTFMDASSSKVFLQRNWADKVAAGFTHAAARSGDKLATLQQLANFAARHSMYWVSQSGPACGNNSQSTEDSLNRDGCWPSLISLVKNNARLLI